LQEPFDIRYDDGYSEKARQQPNKKEALMKPVIAHSLNSYLFLTGSWIYSQITGIRKFRNIVLSNHKKNTELFPWPDTCFLSDLSGPNRFLQKTVFKWFGFYPCFYRLMKDQTVGLLHSHFGNRGYFDLALKKKLGIPQVTTFYGYDVSVLPREEKWRTRYAALFAACDRFLTEGTHMKQTLVDLGCVPEKVTVQRLGVDLEKIRFIPRRMETDRNVRLLFASAFRDKKGLTYCLEAFANALQTHGNMELTIIGDAGRGRREMAYKARVLKIIRDRRLENKVRMLGFLNYPAFIEEAKNHDIFLGHSIHAPNGDNEGGAPVTLIEMSAYGMPVISTRHCDIPEVIQDNQSGLLVPEKDVDALTDRIVFLAGHPERWEKMGRFGRKHVEEAYDIRKQVLKLEDIYTQMMAHG